MNTIEAIYKRRAVKAFDAGHSMSTDEERKLLEATIQAPTSFNAQHWRMVIIRDPELRAKIRKEFGNDQAQMTDASLLVLFTADVKAWAKKPERYWVNAPDEVAELLVNWMGPFHEGRDWLQRDEAQRSIGIAMQTLMLAAQELGYQSCPMIGFDPAQFSEILGLDADHPPLMIVVVGKGTKPPFPRLGLLDLEEVVSVDRFGNHAITGSPEA